ncbi:unnamed protein product, partial [Symbiodinium microadriaticum]
MGIGKPRSMPSRLKYGTAGTATTVSVEATTATITTPSRPTITTITTRPAIILHTTVQQRIVSTTPVAITGGEITLSSTTIIMVMVWSTTDTIDITACLGTCRLHSLRVLWRLHRVVVGGGSSPDLHGASICLPRLGLHAYDKVVYFEVVVTPENGAPWQVLRRYNHFRALAKDPTISAVFAGATRSFPTKIWHTPSREELQERRSRLEEWLKAALIQASTYGELPVALRKFLLLGRTPKLPAEMQAAPATGKLQDSTLSFAAEAFDNTTASAPLAEGGDDGLELLHVPIPASL